MIKLCVWSGAAVLDFPAFVSGHIKRIILCQKLDKDVKMYSIGELLEMKLLYVFGYNKIEQEKSQCKNLSNLQILNTIFLQLHN